MYVNSLYKRSRSLIEFKRIFMFALLSFGIVGASYAGTGGTEFATIYTQLTDWSEGTLGKIIALGMILVGLGWGVVKQSVMAVVVGVAGGLILSNAPAVVDNIMGATII